MVRAAADRPGVLYAFIVLDNPSANQSILDMQVGARVRGAGGVSSPPQKARLLPSSASPRSVDAAPKKKRKMLRRGVSAAAVGGAGAAHTGSPRAVSHPAVRRPTAWPQRLMHLSPRPSLPCCRPSAL